MADDKLFSALLKYWRGRRGMSQLDLALSAGVSSRHVSFLETGRSRPSEEMVLLIGNTLDVPLREQNAILRAAGFEPRYAEPSFDALGEPAIERAIQQMMQQHEPYPMLTVSCSYDVLAMNNAANRPLTLAVGHELGRFNAIDALFDPQELRPVMVNWTAAAQETMTPLRCANASLNSPACTTLRQRTHPASPQ
jgi:transcriptional regulator with XRE-family HTH domain